MDLPRLMELYLVGYRQGHAASAAETWERWLSAFQRFWRECGFVGPLQACHLDDFQRMLETTPDSRGRAYAPATVYQATLVLRGFLRWACEHGHLAEDPLAGRLWMEAPARRVMPRLSPPQVLALLQAAPPVGPLGLRDRTLLETFVGTRLPVTHAGALQLEHLDLAQGVLHDLQGPSHRLGRRLRDLFERYLAHSRPCLVYRPEEQRLFAGEKGGNLAVPTTCRLIQRYADQAGLNQPVTASTLSRSGPALGAEFHDQPFPSVDEPRSQR